MTKLKLLLVILFCAAVSLQFSSCSSDDGGSSDGDGNGNSTEIAATRITLNNTTLSLQEGAQETLMAALEPTDATGNVAWASSDPAVATVSISGVVTAVKEGTAKIAATVGTVSATCDVTVTKETVVIDSETLNGSSYYIIQMDETSYNSISDKVSADLRPNGTSINLYTWDDTFSGGTSVGDNFYGLNDDWVSLVVANVGWSGFGYTVDPEYGNIDMTDIFDNPDDYYFHIAIKTGQAASSYLLIFNDGVAEGNIAVGDDFVDDGKTFTSYVQLTRDNKWNSIEIPVSALNDLGLYFQNPFTDVNILSVLAGGQNGTTLDIDAAFFYKKN